MKKLLLMLLLCALGLSACGLPALSESDAESPAPAPSGEPEEAPAPAPSEDPEELIEAMRPRLILDGCTPGEIDGLRLEVTGYDWQSGAISFRVDNSGAEARLVEGVALKVRESGEWQDLPIAGILGTQSFSVEPGDSVFGEIVFGELSLNSGEYLLCLGELEAGFWLVYTE